MGFRGQQLSLPLLSLYIESNRRPGSTPATPNGRGENCCGSAGAASPHVLPHGVGLLQRRRDLKKPVKPERKQASSKRQTTVLAEPQGTPPEEGGQRSLQAAFPVVGIGASAGGLEALALFLAKVPAGSGMAFVIVQHLDPTHKGIMAELLQRTTTMQVVQVKDRTRVQPDCVYVIPPNKDMSVLHGVLHLLAPVAPGACAAH